MTQLTSFFADLSFSDPVIWIVLGSGFAVVLGFLLLGRRQRRPVNIVLSTGAAPVVAAATNPADIWLAPAKKTDERRRAARRSGVPTAVHLVDPKMPDTLLEGFVIDRSKGGLRLAIAKPYPTGTPLHVRPANAHPDTPWVTIIIRSCQESGDFFEVGCQFREELSWHMLLQFG